MIVTLFTPVRTGSAVASDSVALVIRLRSLGHEVVTIATESTPAPDEIAGFGHVARWTDDSVVSQLVIDSDVLIHQIAEGVADHQGTASWLHHTHGIVCMNGSGEAPGSPDRGTGDGTFPRLGTMVREADGVVVRDGLMLDEVLRNCGGPVRLHLSAEPGSTAEALLEVAADVDRIRPQLEVLRRGVQIAAAWGASPDSNAVRRLIEHSRFFE